MDDIGRLAFGLPALGAAIQVAWHLMRREREPVAAAEIPSGILGEINLPAREWRA